MGSVLDPVTGLPLVDNPLPDVEQIPLGTQILDWRGLKATDIPKRQSLYPDDFIPVTSLLQGMYNDAAQLIQTDGNNAAKVYVVNESGGGGGGLDPQTLPHNISNSAAGGINTSVMHQLDYTTSNAKYVLGVTATFNMMASQFVVNVGGSIRIGLSVDGSVFTQTLFQTYIGKYATVPPTPDGTWTYNWSITFPMGIDIQASYPGNTGVGLYSFCTAGLYQCGGCLIYS